jgi:hypothetical protein
MLVDKAAEVRHPLPPAGGAVGGVPDREPPGPVLRNEPGARGRRPAPQPPAGSGAGRPLSVVHYDDPDMDHFDYYDRATPYFTPRQIWEFFKKHPRTPLPLVRP